MQFRIFCIKFSLSIVYSLIFIIIFMYEIVTWQKSKFLTRNHDHTTINGLEYCRNFLSVPSGFQTAGWLSSIPLDKNRSRRQADSDPMYGCPSSMASPTFQWHAPAYHECCWSTDKNQGVSCTSKWPCFRLERWSHGRTGEIGPSIYSTANTNMVGGNLFE